MKRPIIILTAALLLTCCTGIPKTADNTETYPSVFPDVTDITVPANIAPVTFMLQDGAASYVTTFESGDTRINLKGSKVSMPVRKWRRLTERGDITVTVYARTDGSWIRFKPFTIHVSDDPIDRYISYRIIPPSFESYQRLTINQRDLTSFDEKVIYANTMGMKDGSRQCINCHSYKNYRTDNMQFHVRHFNGGTIMLTQGHLRKINLKTDSTISSGVYPAWHPTHDYVAYSTNLTYQNMHTDNPDRIEVYDRASDLILYDVNRNSVSIIENDSTQLECFPSWSPDGKTLYYVSAGIGSPSQLERKGGVMANSTQIRYDLYAKDFNPDSREWGPSRLIINADSIGQSITLPRVSPDGRWLLYSMAPYGVFHIWHSESDLWMMDLKDSSVRRLDELNSPEVESYHSWSSNGKWVIFSTRRDDGGYTRLYIAHMDGNGKLSKPFQLPQRDPAFSRKFMFSFNIPEFMIEPVRISARRLASFIRGSQTTPVSFETQRTQNQ